MGRLVRHRRAAGAVALAALVALAVPVPTAAQEARPTGRITGTVHDSLLARGGLAGAEVLLDALGRVATTDAQGRFAFDSVPAGEWRVAFFHPELEPFGITPAPARVTVAVAREARVALATPSPATLFRALCGAPPSPDAGLLLVSAGAAAGGDSTRVRAEWVETALQSDLRVSRQARRADGAALGGGAWTLCGVPAGGDAVVVREAGRARQAAGVQASAFGLVRLPVPAVDPAAGERLVVSVRDSLGRAIPGADVRVGDAAETTIAGGWTAPRRSDAAQRVEARAVGFVPVSVVLAPADDVRTLDFVLPPARTTIAPVTVTGTAAYLDRVGFEARRKDRLGHYITQEEIERRKPQATGDLFFGIPGLKVTTRGGRTIVTSQRSEGQAGKYGGGGGCQPVLYVDGMKIPVIGQGHVAGPNSGGAGSGGGGAPGGGGPMSMDTGPGAVIQPHDIAGIEVYTSLGAVPIQYRGMDAGCGVILFWTRRAASTH